MTSCTSGHRSCRAGSVARAAADPPEIRIGRVVAELLILDQVPDHIDPKAVDALRSQKRITSYMAARTSRIAPVQIRLLRQERMVVVLSGRRIELPGAAAELRQPVVGGPPSGGGSGQRYQSRLGLSREDRLSTNQGC